MTKNRKLSINIPVSVFSPVYIKNNILNNKSRYLVLFGGAGSGKSKFTAQKFIYRMISETGHTFLFVRKVARTLRNSVFKEIVSIIDEWGLSKLFKINKSDMEIIFTPNKNRIIFVGIDDPEKIKSVSGITSIWIEEASELKKEDFDQLDLRLRGRTNHYKQILITFNPISELSWLKKHFFDIEQPETTILKTTYLDNPFLDSDYIKKMERLEQDNPDYYRIYALGNWGIIGQMVYTNWKVEEFDKTIRSNIWNGLDFGFNDPNAFVRVSLEGDTIYILDELYERELTTDEVAPLIEAKMDKRNEYLLCDAVEPDRIKTLKKLGFQKAKAAKKGAGSIEFGIDFIKSKKVVIHPSCKNFIGEIQQYQYMKDKDGNYIDKPIDNYNHLMDSLRYALSLEMKQKKEIGAGKFNLY